jgi:iron complex outermembrane receptor protein
VGRTSLTVPLITALTGLALIPAAGQAQDVEPVEITIMEEIISVGTRAGRERTATDSAVPVDSFGLDELSAGSLTETSRALQFAAPSFNFSTSTISDGTDITRPSTLRGMNPDQTLVLVNGKRRHNTALMHVNGSIGRGTAGVDLNAIPPSSIERIEVLRDGAAAQYGSDAIAGVINIVLKDQTETIDPYIHWGSTYNGDGDTFQASVNAGIPIFGDGFLNVTGEFRDREATNHSGRDPRQQYNFLEQVAGEPDLQRSLPRDDDDILIPADNDGFNYCTNQVEPGDDPGDVAGFSLIDCTDDPRGETFNTRNHRYGDPDSENWYLSWNAAIPLFGESELYSFGGIARRDGESGGFYRRAEDARTVLAINPDGFLPLINTEVDDDSFALGLRGEVIGWNYDASVVYGENEFNFFISNSNNVALGAASPTSADAGTLSLDQLTFNFDVSRLFDVGGTDVNLAAGIEWREDGYEIEAGEDASWCGPVTDDLTPLDCSELNQFGGNPAAGIQVFPGFQPANALDQDRNAWAIYADVEADITDRWLLSGAVRFEDYDDFGNTTNFKIATRYDVVEDVLALRGAVSTGFRAPSLQQQFFNNISTQFVTVGGVPNVPVEVGTFRNDSDVVSQGFQIPSLSEEESTNISAGFVWSPLDNFTVTVDAYYIEVDDRVVLSGRFTAEDEGTDGQPCAPDNSNCPIRSIIEPFGVNAAQFFSNAIDTETKGIDIIGEYAGELDNGAVLTIQGGVNFTSTEVDEIRIPDSLVGVPGAENTLFSRQEVLWLEEAQPEDHYILSVRYDQGPFSTLIRANRFGEVTSTESPNDSCEADNSCLDQTFGGETLVDVEVSWLFNDNIRVTAGANNIFDVQPDQQTSDTNFNGIFPYSRRTTPFGFNGGYYYLAASFSFAHGL